LKTFHRLASLYAGGRRRVMTGKSGLIETLSGFGPGVYNR
jgi:hypothetical protein